MTELQIRDFQSADYHAVIALWDSEVPSSQPWNEPAHAICRKLAEGDELFFVGEKDGQVIATVLAGYDGVRGWIYSLAVANEVQRQGIGRRMLTHTESALKVRGCEKINLQVRETNAEVIAFYERCGYAVEDRASLGKAFSVRKDEPGDPVPTIRIDDDITLSQITWEDKPAYLEHLNTSNEFQERMGMMPYPYHACDADQWISRVLRETWETDGRRNWGIRDANGTIIGGIGIFDRVSNHRCELGYWLAKPFWGQGVMTKIVNEFCPFVFQEFDLGRLTAQVLASNPASARVLKRASFQHEGTLRNHAIKNGEPVDVLLHGRLATE